MTDNEYREVWDLDILFSGGSESDQFRKHLEELEVKVSQFKSKIDFFHTPQVIDDSIKIAALLEYICHIRIHLSQANSFIACLLAENPKDQKAAGLQGELGIINARFESVVKTMQRSLVNIENKLWEALIDTDILKNYGFILNKWKQKGQLQRSENEENLISDLMVDGYHAWGQYYNVLMSDIKVHVSIKGKIKALSVGQAINLRSHPDEEVRKESHKALENIWIEKEEVFSRILNHITGFRLQVNKNKGIENPLIEPLLENHMKEETLNSMWRAVSKHKQPFINYLNKKAEILGETKLNSYNFWAPISESKQQINYDEAVNIIKEQLSRFGSELEKFSRQAFEKGWIESANRPNKAAVAFCAGFPLTGESRVFMTYSGTITDVLTLAHELGHAFHNHAMKSVEGLNKQYPLSIAETASIFSEMIVLDNSIEKARSNKERIFLLDEKLKRSVMNFMNIHSRFLFEKNFYEERKEGIVSSSRLNELMEDAIIEGYNDSIAIIPIHSWIWTPHYYITKSPFYNFPYTFGYLFSLSIYAKAKEEGKEFETKYLALLRDSGSMSVEDLVMKHLGEDITTESFWEKGLELCVKDVEEFIQLAEERSE